MRTTLLSLMRQVNSVVKSACQDAVKNYEEAVRALNTLQSNAAVIEKVKKERNANRHLNLPQTVEFASRVGITLDDIDHLSIIHISGTKGKGSTCAFSESILRAHGYKTGFFSSPHLVEVRERIRINGKPLSREAFSSYFWDCYKSLDETKSAYGESMPSYFRFLTIMAFYVFLKEQVDVAIVEVGIGGQYDCTNIIRVPVVCGVSSLGMDHVSILGDTLDSIAWNKAGIFKPNVPAVTVPQPENSLQVIIDRAREIGCPLWLTPGIKDYDWHGLPINFGIQGRMQHRNATLALQLCRIWLQDHDKSIKERQEQYKELSSPKCSPVTIAPTMSITSHIAKGLSQCHWPGRNQTIKKPRISYYIDGAHTVRSIQQCMEWFLEQANKERSSIDGRVARVLIFNATGDRRPETLLQVVVQDGQFDCAAFCPNIATLSTDSADQTNYTVTLDSQLSRCHMNRQVWLRLHTPIYRTEFEGEETLVIRKTTAQSDNEQSADTFVNHEPNTANNDCAQTFNSIHEALTWVGQGRDADLLSAQSFTSAAPDVLRTADHVQVLCTGSLHLIGGVLRLLNPDLNDETP